MRVVFVLFDGVTALDVVGPLDVLCRVPGAEVVVAGVAGPGTVRSEIGALGLSADVALAEAGHPDVLVVPGGWATRVLMHDESLGEWLRAVHPSTTWTTSVCTGSLILGGAGLLSGVRATTHWNAFDVLASTGALPVHERVVVDGKILTGAGVSAGIDMALRLVAMEMGDAVAQAIQLSIEYDPQPPFDSGSPARAPAGVVEAVRRSSARRASRDSPHSS